VRTLVISDLHLGVRSGVDVLARPEALDVLCSRLHGVDRLVLLGDTLELRHGPARDALARAEPVMRAIGDALGASGEVVVVAGNHDHPIVAGWLDWRGRREEPAPLGLDERVAPHHASWIAKRLAGWLSPASVELAYPGLWLRDDVYATHGHYLDAHCVIPTLEVLAGRVMARMVGEVPRHASAEDYEAVLAPVYGWIHASAQRSGRSRRSAGGGSAIGVWHALEGDDGRGRPRRAALRAVGRARRSHGTPQPQARAPRLRPHPPDRHPAARPARRVAHAVGDAAAQRRLLGLRDALHGPPAARREPVLARGSDHARRRRAAALGAPARAPGARGPRRAGLLISPRRRG